MTNGKDRSTVASRTSSRLNGQEVLADQAFDVYRALIDDLFETEPDSQESANDFRFDLGAAVVGELFLHWGYHGPARYNRPESWGRRQDLDEVALMLAIDGEWECDFGTHRHVLKPGQMVLLDRDRPMDLASKGSSMINLNIPRRALGAHFTPRSSEIHGRQLDGAAASILSGHMSNLTRHPLDSPQVADATQLLVTACLVEAASHTDYPTTALRSRAIELIERQLSDPRLGVETLVERLGVSRPSLYRAFSLDGGVISYIRKRRLAKAHDLLSRDKVTRVSTLAQDLGFSNGAHFSESFRKRYGYTPRDLRRAGNRQHDMTRARTSVGRLALWEALAAGADPAFSIRNETPTE